MALHSRGGCHATTRRLQQYGRPYQPKHSPSYSSHFDFVRARPVICHSAVRLLLLSSSIGPCRWPSLRFSSAFLRSLFTQCSHPSCGLPRFLQPSLFFVSVSDHCVQLFCQLLPLVPTSLRPKTQKQ